MCEEMGVDTGKTQDTRRPTAQKRQKDYINTMAGNRGKDRQAFRMEKSV